MIDGKSDKLFPLTPKDNIEDKHKYKEYLDQALKKNDVSNIALSGNYGSGKSSILATYFKNNEYSDKYLQISLANFRKKDEVKLPLNPDDSEDSVLKNIEKNIINQILYQISSTKIPLTSFRIKREMNVKYKLLICSEFVLILSLFLPVNIFKDYDFTSFKYLLLSVFIFWNLWSMLKFLPIKKINFKFQNIETEIQNQNDELFEKYADEIMYLLEKSDKEILIIEDLDRFEQLNIFEKLRELNTKINNKLKNDNKNKKFVFIYAIKDNLFEENKDRTKFFDLIIPVIPYLSANNSYGQMKNELFKDYSIDDNLLYILSFFIDDMRLLTNIRNEFIVYKNEIELSDNKYDEKLLSIIVYKNLFHKDFEKLKFRNGTLYEIITSVQKYKFELNDRINSLKNDLNEFYIERKKQIAKTEEDFFILWMKDNQYRDYGMRELKNFVQNPGTGFLYQGNNMYENTTYCELKENEAYKQRLDLILLKETKEELDLKDKISDLEKRKSGKLKDLLQEDDIPDEYKVIYRLIKQGYIDENYEYYINYDRSEKRDTEFINNIFYNNVQPSFDMKLNDCLKIYMILTMDDYNKEGILNVSLLDFLIKKRDTSRVKMILNTARKSNNNFLEMYYKHNKKIVDYLIEFDIKIDLILIDEIDDRLIENNLYLEKNDNFELIISKKWNHKLDDTKEIQNTLADTKIFNTFKLYFISELKIKIDLTGIDTIFFDALIINSKVNPVLKNILIYKECNLYSRNKLIEFINKNGLVINSIFSKEESKKFIEMNQLEDEEQEHTYKITDLLFNDLVNSNQLQNDQYKEIFEKYNLKQYTRENLSNDLDKEKIQILSDLQLLEFSKDMVEFLEEKDVSYVEGNEQEIFDILKENNDLQVEDFQIILDSTQISLDDRKKLFVSFINVMNSNLIESNLENLNFEPKLISIMNHTQNFFNNRVEDNEENRLILEHFQDKSIISEEQFEKFFK